MNKTRPFMVCLLVLAVQLQTSRLISASSALDDDYEVYSALINQKYVTDRIKLIVIKDQTVSYTIDKLLAEDPFQYVSKQLAPVSKETFEDFLSKNESPIMLNRQFILRVDYALIGQEELDNFLKPPPSDGNSLLKGWERFYEKYPHSPGYLMLSRIGYNAGRDEAMVYSARCCGALCGEGRYILVTKDRDGWRIKNELNLWIS